jgi:ribosomal protein L35AE/L33A
MKFDDLSPDTWNSSEIIQIDEIIKRANINFHATRRINYRHRRHGGIIRGRVSVMRFLGRGMCGWNAFHLD